MVYPIPSCVVPPIYTGCYFPYDEWPKELKDEYGYNPEKAKKLLAEAGYPNGFKTTMLAGMGSDLQLAQVLKAYLLDIGVDATIDVKDMPTMMGMISSKKNDGLVFEPTSMTGTLCQITKIYHSKDVSLNKSQVNSPEYDSVYQGYITSSSEDEAYSIMRKLDKMGLEQHWAVQTFPKFTYNIYQPYLMGYSGEDIRGTELQAFYFNRLWIDQDLKEEMLG